MTTVQITINKAAGVAILRTIQAHGRQPVSSRSLFNGANRQVVQLLN